MGEFTEQISYLIAFFSDGQFHKIVIGTLLLFAMMFVTWWLYRSISSRNLFNFLHKHGSMPNPTVVDRVLYAIRYLLLFPLYSFSAFLIFALALFITTHPETASAQQGILFIAIVLVSTIRLAAYVHENMAEDLAKMMPLSLLAAVIAKPSIAQLGVSPDSIRSFFLLVPGFAKYMVFIVMLEVVLRSGEALIGGHAGFDPKSETADE